ncbi:DHA2 family efflux MFS transporter permease subunit [Hamadaea tsunoensis]|uniref:DHA2 family efflux MFS transporter permease subunit n=1 Tax=Hamadaea tsunoensis TaxID=53368 RepID=UPI00041427B2|nr:DHA2 family efflux MFS transporter permease subunit [Hamadaea tsunoensis]
MTTRVPRPLWTWIAASVAVFMVSMDNLVVTNALPVIRLKLDAGLEGLEWTVNAYTLSFAVFLLTGAALGDRFGRRRLFTIGLVVFTLASAAAALAPNIGILIAARAVQGVGGAIAMPLTLTLLASVVPPQRRGVAFGVWSATAGLGVALGPVIGGAITEYWSWQWIFWVNVPIGLLLLPVLFGVRESRGGAGRLDPVGTVLATLGLFGVVFGMVRGNQHGWTSAQVLTGLVGGGVLLAAFLLWELRAPAPMIPLGLFRSRGFALTNTVALLMAFGMFGAVFLGAQFLQTVQGYSPLEAGVRTLPWTAMPVLTAPLAGMFSDRLGARRILALGLALQAAGIGWLAVVLSPEVAYGRLVPAFVLAGAGMGLFFAPIARLTIDFAPVRLQGVASGTSNALRQLGTVLGVAALGTVFSSVGGYASAQSFVDGTRAAEWIGAAVLAVATVFALFLPAASVTPEASAADAEALPEPMAVA